MLPTLAIKQTKFSSKLRIYLFAKHTHPLLIACNVNSEIKVHFITFHTQKSQAWRIWKSQAGGVKDVLNCKLLAEKWQQKIHMRWAISYRCKIWNEMQWWGFQWYSLKGIYLRSHTKLGCDYPYGSVTVCAATIIPASNTANIITSDQIPPSHLTVPQWRTLDESRKDETQRSCDKICQHYSTMRILTPKRTLEDRSDISAMLLCTATRE